jgi:uncharacterized protein with FMN-binding domain
MRRAIPVVIATAGGAALLASFHTSPSVTSVGASATASTAATDAPAPTTLRRAATTTTEPPLRSFDGQIVQTRYGPVEVRVAVRGQSLIDVQALVLPNSHPRSAEISNHAAPILRQEALQAQSARINLVSGASYTSQGYAISLQAALDRARA